ARGDRRLLVVHDWLAAPHVLSPERREPPEGRCMERERASVLALPYPRGSASACAACCASSSPVTSWWSVGTVQLGLLVTTFVSPRAPRGHGLDRSPRHRCHAPLSLARCLAPHSLRQVPGFPQPTGDPR